jgi:hypothetical protein
MELGALYERPVTKTVGLTFYGAPSGEPALGPVAFMHRPSAMDNPTAPIGHHWQDATHIVFGVLTTGIFTHTWKLEASTFNGREPDENRWDIDPIRLDSYSGRLTVNPTDNWSFTSGYGFIHSPEALRPEESLHRMAASALYGDTLGSSGQWATALIWGANKLEGTSITNSALAEGEAVLDSWNTIFGRTEWLQKSAADLVLPPAAFPDPNRVFDVGTLELGYIREVRHAGSASFGIGVMGTLNVVPSALQATYGSRAPVGGMIFFRLRPVLNRGAMMSGMGGMKMDGGEMPP